MTRKVIYNLVKNLIENKFYNDREDVEEKINVYFAFDQIDKEQMTELMLLTKKMYEITEILEEDNYTDNSVKTEMQNNESTAENE